MNDDSVRYEKVLNEFVDLEDKGLKPIEAHDSISTEEFIRRAEAESVPAFRRMHELIKEAEHYDLPERGKTHRSLLKQYAALRMEHIQTYIKAEKEQDPVYIPKMDSLTEQINIVIATLNKASSQ